MPKRKCFFEEPQKNEYVSVYQPVTRHPQRPGSLSVHPHAMAATGGETSRQSGSVRVSSRPGPKGVRYGRPPHAHPHGSSSSRKQHLSRDAPLCTPDRGGPKNGPRRMLQVRTASASIALSTERVPLPSDPNAPRYHPLPPGKAQSTSWYQQLTRT